MSILCSYKRHIWVIALILLMHSLAFSQDKKPKLTKEEKKAISEAKKEEKKKRKEKRKHPENIEDFAKNFLFRPRYVYPGLTMSVFTSYNKAQKFNWKTATPGLIGGSIRIKKVLVSAAFKIPSSDALLRRYGDTKFTDVNVNIMGRIVNWQFFYRDYKGLYLSDYQDFYPNWKVDSTVYPHAPNLHIIEGGMNIGFNFNRNFSMSAAFGQSERQKKSAGSFLLGVQERYQRISCDSNLVPATKIYEYPNLYRFDAGDFLSTMINLGVGYQFVYKKFHFTPVLMVGTGIQFQNYGRAGTKRFGFGFPGYGLAKAQIGYNGDYFFTNIIYSLEFSSIPINESRIRLYHNLIEFGIGVRF